ncbi:hypothetical protein IJI31_02955 [bacterium]|nr:hypothetical protein [bacterium]
MKITPIQFNFVQSKPQNTVNRPLQMNKGLMTDVVSFTGSDKQEKTKKKLEDLEPKHKGIIYKKVRDEKGNVIKKIPVEVDIVNWGEGEFQFKLDDECIGYVQLHHIPAEECDKNSWAELYMNYKEEGVVGDRLEVKYLSNQNEEEYGGIGHLADLLEVAACKEMGIKPNVISHAALNASPLHYVRGKRFIPYERYCSIEERDEYDILDKNPNDTIKEIIESTPKGEKFDTSELDMFLVMYMPKDMIKSLEKELKKHPIF